MRIVIILLTMGAIFSFTMFFIIAENTKKQKEDCLQRGGTSVEHNGKFEKCLGGH